VPSPAVGVVVPTLGQRADYLQLSLRSIRAAGNSYILLVAPESLDTAPLTAAGLIDEAVVETGKSLPAAINQGVAALPADLSYVAWLGDDDLLRPDSLGITETYLHAHRKSAMVYGRCDYIDESGTVVWTNRSGPWAAPLLRIGPDLIPQPGSLFRRTAFESAGGLRTDLGWAFDLDLFLRLARFGRLSYVSHTLAAFRWHAGSLSVGQRGDSVREASQVRREFLPAWVRPVSGVWERPVRWATNRAGDFVGSGSK
jgi:GT2 family glycosyltransferase